MNGNRLLLSACLVAPVVTTLALGWATSAIAADLGRANDFNLLTFGDVTQSRTDVEGKVAIAGNAELQDFYAGMALNPNTDNGDVLIVGKNLSFSRGTVNGNVVYGDTANLDRVTLNKGTARQGNPIDFTALGKELRSLSTNLSGLAVNGSTNIGAGDTITFSGSNSDLNIFNISSQDLGAAKSININTPDNATVLVNVDGENIEFGGFGFLLNGKDTNYWWKQRGSQNVVYNFYQAKNLKAEDIGIVGSVLAPNADFIYNNGQINGNVIVRSLQGNGQTNNVLFRGKLPDDHPPPTTTVPEPSTLVSLGLIVGATILSQRQFKKAA